MIKSIETEKSFDKAQYMLMIRLKNSDNFLNLTKSIYQKPRANVNLTEEHGSILFKTENGTRMLSLLMFNIVEEGLSNMQ